MRSAALLLLAAAASAQSTVEIFNIYPEPTLTFASADAKATTYTRGCPPSSSLSLEEPTEGPGTASKKDDVDTSMPTNAAPLRRAHFPYPVTTTTTTAPAPSFPDPDPTMHAFAHAHRRDDTLDYNEGCNPYTVIQGASTWEFHFTQKDVATADAACHWSGASKQAAWTCAVTDSAAPELLESTQKPGPTTTTQTLKQTDLTSLGEWNHVTVMEAEPTAAKVGKEGAAVAGPVATGKVRYVGVAGLFVAAVVL